MTFQSACLALGQLLVLISAWMLYRTSQRLERIFSDMRSLLVDAKNHTRVSDGFIREGAIVSLNDSAPRDG